MNTAIIVDFSKIASLDFIPTIIVGFYQNGNEKLFFQRYERLKDIFPYSDIVGCSSESNIYDMCPHADIEGKHLCIFLCIEMRKSSYLIQYVCAKEKQNIFLEKNKKYSAIVLSSHYNNELENLITTLQKKIGKNNFFGAVAGGTKDNFNNTNIFYNGKYYYNGTLVWLIDQEQYLVKGISVHGFDSIGFEMEITCSKENVIFEIENRPALDIIEEMIGTLDQESIVSFYHPLCVASKKNGHAATVPLVSIFSVDRKKKTLNLYKNIFKGDKLKLTIPMSRAMQENQLQLFKNYVTKDGIAFLFICVAYKGHWGNMEPIYLMRLAKYLQIPFIGFHSLGEIGPLDQEDFSLMQNQTLTLTVISEKEG